MASAGNPSRTREPRVGRRIGPTFPHPSSVTGSAMATLTDNGARRQGWMGATPADPRNWPAGGWAREATQNIPAGAGEKTSAPTRSI